MKRSMMLLAVLSAGCGGSSDPQAPDGLGPLVSRDPAPTVVLEYFSGVTQPTSRLITSAAAWNELWAVIYRGRTPVPAVPEIDFNRDALVVVGLGNSPGLSLRIEGVRRQERGVVAETRIERYSERCLVLTAIGQPVHVVRIARPAHLTLRVESTEHIIECN